MDFVKDTSYKNREKNIEKTQEIEIFTVLRRQPEDELKSVEMIA